MNRCNQSNRQAATILFAAAALLSACGSEGASLNEVQPFQQALRPDNPAGTGLFRFASGDQVIFFDSPGGSFRVHYTEAGPNAVLPDDLDGSGIPDFVEEVATVYDQVLAFYRDVLGFQAPLSDLGIADNGDDGRFDVYLVDFGLSADGAFQIDTCLMSNPDTCIGYIVQENDFAGYHYPTTEIANRVLGSHEFFHAVQAAYDMGQDALISEGSAVWATEAFDASLSDFEAAIGAFLDSPERSLNRPAGGPVAGYNYGAGLLFWFLHERYGNDLMLRLWEGCVNGSGGVADPAWFDVLLPLLASDHGVQFPDMMVEFATWNLMTGRYADPARGYDNGAGYPALRFEVEPSVLTPLPYSQEGLRIFPASARYFGVLAGGEPELTAALVGPASELADLTVLLAPRTGSSYLDVVRVDQVAQGLPTVDTSAATDFVVVVVNTATDGNSRRPALCIGTPAQVEACHKAIDPSYQPEPPPQEAQQGGIDEGCGCNSSAGAGTTLGWLLLLGAISLLRRSPTSR